MAETLGRQFPSPNGKDRQNDSSAKEGTPVRTAKPLRNFSFPARLGPCTFRPPRIRARYLPAGYFRFRNKVRVVHRQTGSCCHNRASLGVIVPDSKTALKPYSSPRLNELTPEQAKLLLLGQATLGDQGAKDLLGVIFPDPNVLQERVSPCLGERLGGIVTRNTPKASRLLTRALMIPKSLRQSFMRFIRG